MPRHVHSRVRARASPPTRCTPHRLGRQAIFPFCSAWAWDGGGGIVSLSQHTSPPYHRAPPSLVGAIASYPPSSYPRRAPRATQLS
eukprot:scaffold22714_cov118-Isochrysis_galbana.AAC.2